MVTLGECPKPETRFPPGPGLPSRSTGGDHPVTGTDRTGLGFFGGGLPGHRTGPGFLGGGPTGDRSDRFFGQKNTGHTGPVHPGLADTPTNTKGKKLAQYCGRGPKATITTATSEAPSFRLREV